MIPAKTSREFRRYCRLAASSLARSLGYDPRRLRKAKASRGGVVYGINGAPDVIVVDEAGNAQVEQVSYPIIQKEK